MSKTIAEEGDGGQLVPIRGGVFARKNATALREALSELGYELRLNTRAARVEYCREVIDMDGKPTGRLTVWSHLDDEHEAELRDRVAGTFNYVSSRGPAPLKYGRELWEDTIKAIIHHIREDPFEVYLSELPAWDGTPRIDGLLEACFEVEDTPLNRWASSHLVLGPIARTFEPGKKLDQMVTLCGDQGIGKSTLIRLLLPPDQPDWFSDSLNLAASTKERAESLLGRVIVEASEMGGINRAELESLKAFITRQDDGNVRLSYARRPATMLRRCIIVGTADRDACLPNDPAGLRRFLPVQCLQGTDVESYLDDVREQLWAEGLHRYREDPDVRLPRELLPEQAEIAEQHRSRDSLLEDALDKLSAKAKDGQAFTLAEIAADAGFTGPGNKAITLGTADQKRLIAALKTSGWWAERQREDGKRRRVWLPPTKHCDV